MTNRRRGPERILAELETPPPPAALREDVLRRAAPALARPAIEDRWERIHSNRLLRAAWAAAVVVLAVAHVLLSIADRRPPRGRFRQEAARRTPELQQVVELPRLREAYVSLDAFTTTAPDGPRSRERLR